MASGARGVLQFVPGTAHAQRRAPSRNAERNRVEDESDEPGPDGHARHDVAHGMHVKESNSSTVSPSDIIARSLTFSRHDTDRRLVLTGHESVVYWT